MADGPADTATAPPPASAKPTAQVGTQPVTLEQGDWSMSAATFRGARRTVPGDDGAGEGALTMFLYGEDEPVTLPGPRPYADPYGDGLLSVAAAEMWPDKLAENGAAELAGGPGRFRYVNFERRSFSWRKVPHALLGTPVPLPEGSTMAEVALSPAKVEAYSGARETENHLIVIEEYSQCHLIAQLADLCFPDPPRDFGSRRKYQRGHHIEIDEFVAARKMYILPRPPKKEERRAVVSHARCVRKAPDQRDDAFSDFLAGMEGESVEEHEPALWVCPGLVSAGAGVVYKAGWTLHPERVDPRTGLIAGRPG